MDAPRPSFNVEEDRKSVSTIEETLISRSNTMPQFTAEPFAFTSQHKYERNDSLKLDEYFVGELEISIVIAVANFFFQIDRSS
jgi:hypothetical protein